MFQLSPLARVGSLSVLLLWGAVASAAQVRGRTGSAGRGVPAAAAAAAASPSQSLLLPRSRIVELGPSLPTAARVGVYGGTFDPMHVGHIEAMETAQEALGLDKMILLPNLDPRFKKDALPFDERWDMMNNLVKGRSDLILPSKEMLKEMLAGPDGIRRVMDWVRKTYPKDARIYHVMGTDSFSKLLQAGSERRPFMDESWPEIVVVERAGYKRPEKYDLGIPVSWIETPKAQPFSSTEFRNDPILHEAQLAEPVARYVKKEGLYGRDRRRGFFDLPRSIASWLIWEQGLNDRVEDLNNFPDSIQDNNGISPEYLPERRPVFWIDTVEIPIEEARVLRTGKIPAQLFVNRGGRRYVRFFIHPESRKFFAKKLRKYKVKREYLATPTSSHRSLVIWNPDTKEPPLGVKVSLDVDIGGVRRLVSRGQIERAAAASALIKTIPEADLQRLKIRFFDEPVGVHPQGIDYGFSLRELALKLPEGVEIVPLFSLFSKPARGPPPIVNLAKRSGLPILEFCRKAVIDPLVEQAVYLAFEHGLVGEPHEQNVLMEIKNGSPSGAFWYRDMSGHSINPGLRSTAGKDDSFMPKGIAQRSLRVERSDLLSNVRSYIGESTLYAMGKALNTHYPEIRPKVLQDLLRERLALAVSKRTGIESSNYREMSKAIKDYQRRRAPAQ